jgi:hypothetical protein
MTERVAGLAVRLTLDVAAPQAHAFAVFTERLGSWWPADHHVGKAPMETGVIEPRAGGRWFERTTDGTECDWGRVWVWDPPRRVVLAWMLNPEFEFDPDPAHASEVEVRFIAVDPGKTRVEFEHRKLEVYGPKAAALHESISEGWPTILRRFVEAAAA